MYLWIVVINTCVGYHKQGCFSAVLKSDWICLHELKFDVLNIWPVTCNMPLFISVDIYVHLYE